MNLSELNLLLPEIFLLSALSCILLIDTLLKDSQRSVTYYLSLFTLAGCAWLTTQHATVFPIPIMHGMFVSDALSVSLKLALYVVVAVSLVYSRAYVQARGLYRGEYFVLVLFATLGMMVMISASHFLTLYLGLELLSLSLYTLVALQRESKIATEAAMKYFVLGALASGMLLYGMSMIYGVTGSLYMNRVSEALLASHGMQIPLVFGLVFIVAGLAFKLGVVPFHMWIPDVYHGAPTAVTLFIGTAPKLAAYAIVIRLLVQGLAHLVADWQSMLIVLSVLSMAIGNLVAIVQTNLKRMLAYSTISHMGFLLLGILSGSVNGFGASMFYVVVYALMSLGGFGMILYLSREGFESDNLDDFKGLNQRSPWTAFLMLLLMFSMAGIPPTVGFYAKFAVLQAVVQAGYVWLAVTAVMFSLIGAFYYLRIVKLMYFDAPIQTVPVARQNDMGLILSLNGLAVLLLGILPQPLMAWCAWAIQSSL
jgi:NADH-quinone oxidoreductase subunit N